MENKVGMNTAAFHLQIREHVEILKLRLQEALQSYKGSKFQAYEEENSADFLSHRSPGAGLTRRQTNKFPSYKPHLLRKDECLIEVKEAIDALVGWLQSPGDDFPLERMLWAEQCLLLIRTQQQVPVQTKADAVRYNGRVVKLIDGAYQKNRIATKRGKETYWTDYKIRKAVAGFVTRFPEEFRFEGDLKDTASSGSVKPGIKEAIKDRGVHFTRKPRNKGRGGSIRGLR